MTFTSFLKATVMGCAGCATLLGTIALAGAFQSGNELVLWVAAAWWGVAAVTGSVLGRRNETSPPIASLLADAPTSPSLPPQQPARTLVNRLWPLVLATLGACAFAGIAPQVPAMAAGFPVIWALAWRRQERAVKAIEERDGVRFFIERTSPLRPIRLTRTPWFKAGEHERRSEGDPAAD